MSISLASLSACFQGVIPSIIATSSKDGEPNVTYLSQVYYLDEKHVALSCQFFNKTKQNVMENPYAAVELHDAVTFQTYDLDLKYVRSETEGPLFEQMRIRIEAIASHTGMSGIFRLLSADIYEVLDVRKVDGFFRPDAKHVPKKLPDVDQRYELRALQAISGRLNQAKDLEDLLGSLLAEMKKELGFEHTMILIPDDSGDKLITVASTGYGESGVGAEIEIGKGLIGSVAKEKCILRMGAVGEDLRYGRAVRGETHTSALAHVVTPEIPLPGLPDAQSHLGIPLLVQDRLVGVLAVESKNPMGFSEWHEAFLGIIGNQVAIAMERMTDENEEVLVDIRPSIVNDVPPPRVRSFKFYKGEDCVFVDGQYLIRNVPARILWKLLQSYTAEKRCEFTNRELRLDPWLGLPPVKDNLESRLILLRKRLEQKCPDVRIPTCARGHFRLEVDCSVELIELPC